MRYPSTKIKGCSSCMLLQLKRQHFTSCPKQAKKMRRSHPQLKLPSLREVLWAVWGEKGKRLNKCTIICLLRINLWLEGEWWAFSIARNFSSIARVWNNGLSASSLAWIWYLSVCTLCMPVCTVNNKLWLLLRIHKFASDYSRGSNNCIRLYCMQK